MVTKYNTRDYTDYNEFKFKPKFIHKNLKAVSHDIISKY